MLKDRNKYYYDKASIYDEAIRALRTNIQFSDIDKNLKKLVISSSFPSEGKSNISYELGKSFAQTGAKVLIMECDLRNPSIKAIAKINNSVGITNLLLKNINPDEAILQSKDLPSLHFMLSGPIPPNPTELLSSNAFKELIQYLDKKFDYIIIDTPPIGVVTDAAILATLADGVILVVKSEETKKEEVKNSIERFEHVGGKIIGAVLTRVKVQGSAYKNSYYYNKERK